MLLSCFKLAAPPLKHAPSNKEDVVIFIVFRQSSKISFDNKQQSMPKIVHLFLFGNNIVIQTVLSPQELPLFVLINLRSDEGICTK